MNIFILDIDSDKSAMYHNDRHVVKMITEQNQIVCTALRSMISRNDLILNESSIPYRSTHVNHPCVKWASKYIGNIRWINQRTKSLCHEYTYRYGKKHKGEDVLNQIESIIPYQLWITPNKYPLAIPANLSEGKTEVGLRTAIKLYRQYYIRDKRHLAEWKNREIPEWWN